MIEKLLSVVLFILPASFCYSQNSKDSRYRHYTTEDGLPSSTILYIIQDKRGYIWFSSDAGVTRFDGYQFRNFSKKDGLPDNSVTKIFEDQSGRIWFITIKGELSYCRDDSIFRFNPNGKLEGLIATDIMQDRNGTFWFSFLYDGIFKLEGDHFQKYKLQDAPAHCMSLAQDSSGRSLVGSRTSIIKYGFIIDDRVINYSLADSMADQIKTIEFYVTRKGNIIGTTKSRLFEIKDSIYTVFFPKGNFLNGLYIITVSEDQEGNLLVSTNQGVYQLTRSGADYVETNRFFDSRNINMTIEDNEGNLWFTTNGDGLYFLSSNARNVRNITADNGLEKEVIYSVYKSSKSKVVYLGSLGGVLQTLNGSKVGMHKLVINDSQPSNINDLYLDERQKLWCGIDGGVFMLEKIETSNFQAVRYDYRSGSWSNEKPTVLKLPDSINYFVAGSIKSLVPGLTNELWIASSSGLFKMSMEPNNGIYIVERYYFSKVMDIHPGADGKNWFSYPGGLSYFENNDTVVFGKIFLQSENAGDIEVSSNGILWVATNGSGIFAFDDTVMVENISLSNGLSSDIINTLYAEGNTIWAGTPKGLDKIEVLNGDSFSFSIFHIGKNDGLVSDEVNDIFIEEDTVFVATSKGLSIFQKSKMAVNKHSPKIYLTGLQVRGKDTTLTPSLSLNYSQNDIIISFVGISFESAGKMQYRYRMSNVESEWRMTTLTEVSYPLLPPDNYRFEVVALNEDGTESLSPATLSFKIQPPFWQTWWFRTLMGSLLLLIVAGVIFAIIRYYRSRNEFTKRIFEAEQKALRAQMNPHFVFNALYSIQNFIARNDQYSASIYLAKFSDLVRMILEYSKNVSITVTEEEKFLKTYLEMESLRFENKFDYSIDIAPSVDIYKMKILSMLIQPFVENSIRHGLLAKKSKGEIKIQLARENGYLTCTIEDNGIGRERAMEIKRKKSSANQSRGIAIAQERLELMKNGDLKGNILIVDLKDSEGIAVGTKVIIKIPYSES